MGRIRSKRWNLAEAKAYLSELVERAARGKRSSSRIVARARLVPLASDGKRALRVPGKYKGLFEMTSDFDDPLPPELLAAFYEPL